MRIELQVLKYTPTKWNMIYIAAINSDIITIFS